MADVAATTTPTLCAVAQTIPYSLTTAAPVLTHQRELRKRAETVGDNTCGWVNGDQNTPLVCEYPYHQPCLWSPELHAVGCCAGDATTECAWVTSCVPYSQVNSGCDAACQTHPYHTVCDSAYPYCATATFEGPAGYTYLSCTDTYGPVETMALTYHGGNATVDHMPRYFSSFWYSSSTSSSYSSTSTATSTASHSPTSSASASHQPTAASWLSSHKWAVIGAIAGVFALAALLVLGCFCFVRRKKTRVAARGGSYVPAPQGMPHQEAYMMQQQQTAYQPSYQGNYQGQPYDGVYVAPPR